MSILTKLVTAIRGGASEAGEAIIDANAIRILEQEIRDSKVAVEKAKSNIADLMAEKIGYGRKAQELGKKVAEYEGYARQALDKGDESLALEVAEKMAELEGELEYNQQAESQLDAAIRQQRQFLVASERNVKTLDREAKMVKTTESVQKTTQALSSNFTATGSKLNNARESLERIKARQQNNADRLAAGEQMAGASSGADLEAKLAESGITPGRDKANDILARLKQQG